LIETVSSKIHSKEILFILYSTFYSTVFYNRSCFSYSKFIIYIKYHPYFIILHTTNFFSLISISTTIYYFILIYITVTFNLYYPYVRLVWQTYAESVERPLRVPDACAAATPFSSAYLLPFIRVFAGPICRCRQYEGPGPGNSATGGRRSSRNGKRLW
jgi:hypothetical protein